MSPAPPQGSGVPSALPATIGISLAADPISTDVQAVCGAITAACNFACTPQGQALIQDARTNSATFQATAKTVWDWLVNLVKH